MTDSVKAAIIAAVASVLSSLVTAWATFWQTTRRMRFRDRRKAHRTHPEGERRREGHR